MAEPAIFGWCFGCDRTVEYRARMWHPPKIGRCGPVWPAVRVRDQAEADRLVPELLAIEAPGHIVEWVPGRGSLDLRKRFPRPLFYCPACGRELMRDSCKKCGTYDNTATNELRGIRWLRIAAETGGPPVDIADVRSVVAQCRDAQVPVWIEQLGAVVNGSEDQGPWPVYPLKVMLFDSFLPADLRACRELPKLDGETP